MAKGAGIGGVLGTAFGSLFGPIGSSVGGAGGKVIGGIADSILDKKKDEQFGPTGQQITRASRANLDVAKTRSQEGMSSGSVQRAQEAQNRDIVNENKTLNTIQQNPQMSSLAQEQMGRALVKDITKAHALNRERIMEADIQAEKDKIRRVGLSEDIAMKADNEVKKAEMFQQQREDARAKALISSAAGAIGTVGKAFDIDTDNYGVMNNFGKEKDSNSFDNDWTSEEMDNVTFNENQNQNIQTEQKGDSSLFDTTPQEPDTSAYSSVMAEDEFKDVNQVMSDVINKNGDEKLGLFNKTVVAQEQKEKGVLETALDRQKQEEKYQAELDKQLELFEMDEEGPGTYTQSSDEDDIFK